MTKTEINFNQYMKENDLNASVTAYRYGSPDTIDQHSTVTLLSPEQRRLTHEVGRYQLYNTYGEYCGENMTLPQFNQMMLSMVDQDRVQLKDMTVPNLDVIVDLIHLVNRMGLIVGGTHQVPHDAWEVADDQRLCAAIERGQHTDYDQLIVEDDNDGAVKMIDLNYQTVMTPLKQAYTAEMYFERDCYEVRDQNDKVVLNEIPLSKLGAVLLDLLLGGTPLAISAMLLTPRLSPELLTNAQLLFGRTYRSDFREVKSVSDIKLMSHLPVNQDLDQLTTKYRFIGAVSGVDLGQPIPGERIVTVLDHIYHHQIIADTTEERRILSDWLLKLAKQMHLVITRQERQETFTADIDDVKLEGNVMVDFDVSPRMINAIYPVESVFEVRDHDLLQVQRFDLTFTELTTYLLSCAKQNGIEWPLDDDQFQMRGL